MPERELPPTATLAVRPLSVAALIARTPAALRDTTRLAALEASGVLAGRAASALARIARLAARALGAPRAAVNVLTADAQLAVARTPGAASGGAPNAFEPFDASFCRYVVAARVPLAVSDARADPLVRADGVAALQDGVAYAGAPLCAPDALGGHVLGTVCVVDVVPRAWSDDDLAVLTDLAALACAALDDRAAPTDHGDRASRQRAASPDAARRAGTTFLANVSHELRTPLVAIEGFIDLLEEGVYGAVSDAQREALGRIRRSQQHLLSLVGDVLRFARLEAGAVRYALTDVRLDSAFARAAELVRPLADRSGLTLDVERSAPTIAVRADPDKLHQVLINLLSNAIKFTPSGGTVSVTCTVRGGHVATHVRDTGVGIPLEQQGAIFAPFVQGDAGASRDGTGLGLAIGRDLARGMGGDLTVTSTPGVGSTFTLTLPRGRARHRRAST